MKKSNPSKPKYYDSEECSADVYKAIDGGFVTTIYASLRSTKAAQRLIDWLTCWIDWKEGEEK